jgi:predicted DNA-binding transcriptional regulator AlpA
MTTTEHDKNFGICSSKIYRRYAKETEQILGLRRTAIDVAIRNGDLPEPLPLTEHGSACGWLGTTLIEIQKRRIAMAEARRAARRRG